MLYTRGDLVRIWKITLCLNSYDFNFTNRGKHSTKNEVINNQLFVRLQIYVKYKLSEINGKLGNDKSSI